MPTVPRATRTEETAPLRAGQLSQAPAGAFGGMENVYGEVERIYNEEKKRINTAVGIETDLKLSTLRADIESTFSQLKGKDAVKAVEIAKAEWDKGHQEILQSLANDEQKLTFAARSANHWGGLYGAALRYADKEVADWDNKNRDAWESLKKEEIIGNIKDEARYQQSLSELKAELKDRYKDPLVVEDKYQDYLKSIKEEDNKRRVEAEKAVKEAKLAAIDTANKELTHIQIDGKLSYAEIRKRKDSLTDENYRLWVDRYRQDLKEKEAAAKGTAKTKDDSALVTSLSVEAMTMPLNATSDDIFAFKQKVAAAVSKGQLTPATGRTIIADAENANKIDPMRKAAEDAVVNALKNDYNQGIMGTKGPAADLEYTRQIEAFRRWSRANTDKEPSEYYENVSKPYKETFLFGLIDVGGPDYAKRREELTRGVAAPVNRGPKEGDTKTLSSGNTAIYQNGRWVLKR